MHLTKVKKKVTIAAYILSLFSIGASGGLVARGDSNM
jgi:hypothetical protein